MTDPRYKVAYQGLKLLDDVADAVESMQRKTGRDKGEWTEAQAKEVLKTGNNIEIKSDEHGIPDRVLNAEQAKKVLLMRHRVRERQLNQCRNQIAQVLAEFNCRLQGTLIVDDAMYGKISRLRARDQNGIVTMAINNEKIEVVIND